MAQLSARIQRLLAESQERVLSAPEMTEVINRMFGAKSWAAVMFRAGRPGTKQVEFCSLLKEYGFDTRQVKTNLKLFVAAAKRRLTEAERDELMRTVYGPSLAYRRWARMRNPAEKERSFYEHMIQARVEISPRILARAKVKANQAP